ncbi:hypothetical protein VTO42DRAFT_6659 [Malbranchea cinnamomea]
MRPSSPTQPIPFGRKMRQQFPLDPNYRNLNHGSFGTSPLFVRNIQRKLNDEEDAAPDRYIRYIRPQSLQASREAVAKILNVPVNEVVFVPNATTGVNTVLRNLVFTPGDVIIIFSDIYAACEKTVASLVESTPVQSRKVEYTHPVSHEELVKLFVNQVKKARIEGLTVRVAIFDTVVSLPGVRFPFEKLVKVCREEGILSCVDGAHAIGMIPLDLGKLQPDFFVSNCHKWFFTPRGCAVFHVPRRNQHLIRTSFPTSHGFSPLPWTLQAARELLPPNPKLNAFETLFERVATNDDSPYHCVPAAIEFRQTFCGGEDAITSYCEALAHEAGNRVAEILGTQVLGETGVDCKVQGASKLRQCAFANVQLPISIQGTSSSGVYPVSIKEADINAVARWMEKELVFTHHTMVPVFFLGNTLWVRLSTQIYLELSDFEFLAEALKSLVERVGLGEVLVDRLKV